MDGVVKDVPVPREDPPDDAAYQLIVPAEVVAPKITVPVPQRVPGVVPVIVGIVLTVAVTEVRVPVVHPPDVASTKYCVVDEIDGVVKDVPVPNEDPPDDAAYQLIIPAEAVAPRVTVPVPQTDPGVVLVIVGTLLIVAVIDVLEAVVHPFDVAST
jgi:hypothetical protein